MEQVFNFAIFYLKSFIENDFSTYIILLLLIIPFICFVVEAVLNICLKRNTKGEFFKSVSLISLLLSILFSVGGLVNSTVNFDNVLEVFYYNLTLTTLCYSAYLCLKLVGSLCSKKPKEILIEKEYDKVDLAPTNVKRIVETISCKAPDKKEYSGYLNVDYLRQLIEELKKNELDEQELNELEEFEVYLLNFITRQPEGKERQMISNYIGALFKKLAKYKVVNE